MFAIAADGTFGAVTELPANSPPVGMFEDTVFSSDAYTVPSGCQLLIFSDGASELQLPDGRQLSMDEFKSLTVRAAQSSDWSLDDLLTEMAAVNAEQGFDDDCSLIRLSFD